MKILFAVHRYVPYPGGSEYYVRDMAERLYAQGHDVSVLAGEHKGDVNGVKVTNDYNFALGQPWDLIIVHGCDCITQNIVLSHAAIIKSPICYMVIKPSFSHTSYHGMRYSKYVAYSTSMDLQHIKQWGFLDKARRIRHGIVVERTRVDNLTWDKRAKPHYVSAGGFYPHKGMVPLALEFSKNRSRTLALYGYADGVKPEYPNVTSHLDFSREAVMAAIKSSDGYILNSTEEGFGLVLLEAMINRVPVFARNIAGAKDMSNYVMTYETETELMSKLFDWENLPEEEKKSIIDRNYNFVMTNHTIDQTITDIMDIMGW